jgi:hypothetical protein
MNMNDELGIHERGDGDLARLLGTAGARSRPAADATARVRAAVESEWRKVVASRRRTRLQVTWASAAGVALAAVGVWLARPLYRAEPGPVASLARVVGQVELDHGDGHWSRLANGAVVRAGDTLRSSPAGRAALRTGGGVEIRLDVDTELAFNDAGDADLARGAVYVDSGPAGTARAAGFTLDTPLGRVQHLGTQYAARLGDDDLEVAVREGRVEVREKRGVVLGSAGELLTIGEGGVTRSALPPSASDWDWVASVVPPFDIQGRSVDSFLAWAARETGRLVVYASPQAESDARRILLSGTIEGLTPDQALDAALSTTSLRCVVTGGEIRIEEAARQE